MKYVDVARAMEIADKAYHDGEFGIGAHPSYRGDGLADFIESEIDSIVQGSPWVSTDMLVDAFQRAMKELEDVAMAFAREAHK